MTTTRAAVVDKGGQDPTVQEVRLADIAHDEVLVRIVATGVCHTDVAWASGELWDNFPVVLGHESAGVVEAVGSGVSRVKPGDRVALALAHHCGHCFYCETGRPMLCGARVATRPRIHRGDEQLVQGFGTGGFSELAIVGEVSTIPMPDGVPMAAAAVVGCATSTGIGAVFNIAEVQYGSTVAILGAGGIGLNLLMGCLLAGAARIVVADPIAERRDLALRFGATDVCEPTDEAILAFEPEGYEYVFESAGRADTLAQAVRLTARGGTATLIGAAHPDAEIRINALDFVPSQRRILGCLTGNVRPNVDFPRFFRLYERGRLDLDGLITARLPFDQIAKGFEMNAQAQGIRTVIDITNE